MEQALRDKATAILAKANDLTIATIRDDGFPQATTVGFVSDGLTIFFMCDAKSQKAQNLARDNKVSATVNLPYDDWNQIQGLSLAALAEPVTEPDEVEEVGRMMLTKFPAAAEIEPEGDWQMAVFRLTPKVISVLDYTKGFGHTDLIHL